MSAGGKDGFWKHTLWHRLKWFVGTRPWLFFPIHRRRSGYKSLLVSEKTDICIEGYPRSANSFAVGAFQHAQKHPVRVAHHTHIPANVMRACERGIPTLVLIRDPTDAVVSHVALSKQTQLQGSEKENPVQKIPYKARLRAWMRFYRSLQPYRDRLVAATMDSVIDDMGRVIERVNERFGTNFHPFNHTTEAAAKVHAGRGYHAGPSEQRDRLKSETRADLEEKAASDPSLKQLMDRSEDLYTRFASREA